MGDTGAPSSPEEEGHLYDRQHWESVYSQADPWDYGNAYEQRKYQQTLAYLPASPIGRALEIGCSEGQFTRTLAPRVEHLIAADISPTALGRARDRCRHFANIEYLALDLVTDPLPGDLDLIVCSEILYYMPLQNLGAIAEKIVGALRLDGYLLMAHAYLVVDDPDRTGFDWDHEFGAATIGRTFSASDRLALINELRTPLYTVQLFRRVAADTQKPHPTVEETPLEIALPAAVERTVLWNGAVTTRQAALQQERTTTLPILMYHNVANDGPSELEPYRISPKLFRSQLQCLRRHGYYSISLASLASAMASGTPLPGRPVVITFDDDYKDFLTNAWPELERADFTATVFVVTRSIDGKADWEQPADPTPELLSWDDLRYLQSRGNEISSRGALHKDLTALSQKEVILIATESRQILRTELATDPIAFSYPLARTNAAVRNLIAGCGYAIGVVSSGGRSCLADDPLRLPRIEIVPDDEPEVFMRKLDIPRSAPSGSAGGGARAVDRPQAAAETGFPEQPRRDTAPKAAPARNREQDQSRIGAASEIATPRLTQNDFVGPDELSRLHKIFLPTQDYPWEWHENLSEILKLHGINTFGLIAYMHKMALHYSGIRAMGNAVLRSVAPRTRRPTSFDTQVALVVLTTDAERYLDQVIDFYAGIGIPVTFAVHDRTSQDARSLLARRGAALIEVPGEPRAASLINEIASQTDSAWILVLDDTELPTPALLDFVDYAVAGLGAPAWGFPRAHFRYEPGRRELQYSQFLVPFGDFGDYDRQWRLIARQCIPLNQPFDERAPITGGARPAPPDALIFDFTWLLRSLSQRLESVASPEAQGSQYPSSASHFELYESIPETWHMFTPLNDSTYSTLARQVYGGSVDEPDHTAPAPDLAQTGSGALVQTHPMARPGRSAAPAIAAVICTYNRYDLLQQAIASVVRQDMDKSRFELLVVDNSADRALSQRIAEGYQGIENLRWITADAPGLSNARNLAVAQTKAPLLAFLDDDAVARPQWLGALLGAFERFGPEAAAIGGKVNPVWAAPRPSWLDDHLLDYLSVLDWGPDARPVSDHEWLVGVNLAFRVAAVQEAGGFRTDLGRRPGQLALLSNEEMDLVDDLRRRGYKAFYVPNAEVDHRISAERLSQDWMRRRVVWQAISDYLKDPAVHFGAAGRGWADLMAFADEIGQPDWPARAVLTESADPHSFDKLMTALRNHTMVMLSGFNGVAPALQPADADAEHGSAAADPAPAHLSGAETPTTEQSYRDWQDAAPVSADLEERLMVDRIADDRQNLDNERFRAFLDAYRDRLPDGERTYLDSHYRRFLYTLQGIPAPRSADAAAMEFGTYGFFLVALRNLFGYATVEGTIFENPGQEVTSLGRRYAFDPVGGEFLVHNLDLEKTPVPAEAGTFDFVLAAELIEHFATDPNAFFFEANRVLKPGGHLLLTTPNVACDENIFRLLWRQVPHRYYYYRKDASSDRHNLEYGPDLLKQTVENAGFAVARMWDVYSWSEPRPEILKLIADAGFPDDFRGDDMLFLCIKTGEPNERYPAFLYA